MRNDRVTANQSQQNPASVTAASSAKSEPAKPSYTRERIHEKLSLAELVINQTERWDGLS